MYFIKKDFFEKRDKKEKNDIIIALVVVVVFSVFVYKLMFRNKGEVIVGAAKDLKESVSDNAKGNVLTKNIESLDIKETVNWQPVTIKAEDAYQVGIDSATVVSDIKTINFLKEEKFDELEVRDFSEVQKENVPESNNSVIETISEGLDDDIKSLDSENENIEVLEPENNVDVESIELKEESSKVIEEVSNSIESNVEGLQEAVSNIKDVEVVTAQEEIIEEAKEPLKETVSKPEEDIQEKVVVNESFDCVIVVGAFREAANKKSVIDKLTSLGYAHSEGVLRKGLNYVGVPVACNDKREKQKLLLELNEAFNISSWVKKL